MIKFIKKLLRKLRLDKKSAGYAFLSAFVVELIMKKTAKHFGKRKEEVSAEDMKEMLIANPRILVDYLIDQLKNGVEGFTNDECANAQNRWRKHWFPRAKKTSTPCSQHKLYTLLCGLFDFDKNRDTSIYNIDFPMTKKRLVELGLKEDEEFDQSINSMFDNRAHEFFSNFSNQTVDNFKKYSAKTVNGMEFVFKKIREAYNKFADFLTKSELGKKVFKTLKILGIFIVFILFSIAFLWVVAQVWLFDAFFESFDNLATITGINQYLVKVIMGLLFIPFLIGAIYVLTPNRKKIKTGLTILVSLFVIYNFSLFLLSQDLYFDKEGKATKYFALTPEGIVYSDEPGVDRIYGIEYKPVTPEIIKRLKLVEKGDFSPVDPQKAKWFNPITGDPQLWYFKHSDSSYDFFDKPGYHPIYGEPLQPVTKEILLNWKESSEMMLKKNGEVNDNVGITDGEQKISDGYVFNELNDFKSTINNVHLNSNSNNVIIALPIFNRKFRSIENGFSNQLVVNNIKFLNTYFNDSFYNKGYFDKINSGETNLLSEAGVFNQVDYLILCQLDYSFRNSNTINEELVSCDINLNYKILDKNSAIVNTKFISVVGPGFSEELALKRGMEILSERFSDNIKKIL